MNMPVIDNGLVYSGSLPLAVDLLDTAPRDHEMQRANDSNDFLLRSVAALEEKIEQDDTDPVWQELKRQDMKLNLILDMIGTLLLQQQLLPAPRELQMTASGLRIGALQNAGSAQHCRVHLYIEPAIPKPLTLYGQCHASSQPGMTDIVFNGVGQSVTDNIDKFIFRHHRRRIAQARKA
jgi:hypothetical protein